MKNKILLYSILLMISISCNENFENQLLTPSVDFLSFSSKEAFRTETDKIANMNDKELDIWEKGKSFVSMRSVLHQAYQEFYSVTTEEEHKFLLQKYGDVLTLKDSTITPYINNTLIQSFVNRNGIYKTGDHFNKIVGNYIATVNEGDFQKLSSLKVSDSNTETMDGVSFVKYSLGSTQTQSNGRTKASCGITNTYFESRFTFDPSGCASDRRVTIAAGVYNIDGLQHVRIQVWGQRKSVCSWVSYSNPLDRSSGIVDIPSDHRGPIMPPGPIAVPAASLTGYSLDYDIITGTEIINAFFWTLQVAGKSQGVGENWAIINCGTN